MQRMVKAKLVYVRHSTLLPFLYPSSLVKGFYVQIPQPPPSTLPCLRQRRFTANSTTQQHMRAEAGFSLGKVEGGERKVGKEEEKAKTEGEGDDIDPFHTVPEHHKTYSDSPFVDVRRLSLTAGSGGNGCVSFLRERFIAKGPPNGGDGGKGGSIYIQAVYGEASLNKLGRQGMIKARDGKNGLGKSMNGQKGDDVIIRVPVGTLVKEIERWDPGVLLEDELSFTFEDGGDEAAQEELGTGAGSDFHGTDEKWLHYPNSENSNLGSFHFKKAKYPVEHHLSASQMLRNVHSTPIYLDLSKPTPTPILLLPGGPGGLGNPHFITPELKGPKFATRGTKGPRMKIELELKILADVGLVGLPSAGKSSFLRAISNKKAKVGAWSFTTLNPNVGTVFTEPLICGKREDPMESFTVADIPGLIADAHLNKGLGHDFLRHIERAKVLAFVIDLSRDDPVADLQSLFREIKAYEEGLNTTIDHLQSGMMQEMSGNKQLNPELFADDSGYKYNYDTANNNSNGDGNNDDSTNRNTLVEATHKEIIHTIPDSGQEIKMVIWSPSAIIPRQAKSYMAFDSSGLHAKNPSSRQRRRKISSKPWFVIGNKSDLPGTEVKFLLLRGHLRQCAHDLGVEEIGLVPISARKALGVQGAVDWMKRLLLSL